MTLNKKTLGGGYRYDTPLVTTLEFQSEGVLCGSFDDDNSTEIMPSLPSDDL
ncbi:MAG: hypothetical protein II194_06620 [Bacteroidales bacterium]|nr:hypothetical protein [Bacteroidales bacterium]